MLHMRNEATADLETSTTQQLTDRRAVLGQLLVTASGRQFNDFANQLAMIDTELAHR